MTQEPLAMSYFCRYMNSQQILEPTKIETKKHHMSYHLI